MTETIIYKNTLNMMLDRGYEDAENLIEDISKERDQRYINRSRFSNIGFDFSKYMKTGLKESMFELSYVVTNKAIGKKNYVIFGNPNKPYPETVVDIILNSIIEDNGLDVTFDLVLTKPFSGIVQDKMSEIASKVRIITHHEDFFKKPPFHALSPRYELMTEDEVTRLLDEIKVPRNQMKKILKRMSPEDPFAKYFNYPSGSVVRIIRTPMIPGSMIKKMIDYRVVI